MFALLSTLLDACFLVADRGFGNKKVDNINKQASSAEPDPSFPRFLCSICRMFSFLFFIDSTSSNNFLEERQFIKLRDPLKLQIWVLTEWTDRQTTESLSLKAELYSRWYVHVVS